MIEVTDHRTNGEFETFPEHGMKGRSGPDGDRFLTEIEQALEKHKVVRVPAFQQVDQDLVLQPFDWATEADAAIDASSVIRFDKNGIGSYSVTANPRYAEYLQKIDPYMILPHFHFGWCTITVITP